ncbi:MAG: hypothetical protein F2667_14750 [Actinobacteria bacterium]|uniref:Unannotated protein n=1 Tax=freshwater metagenome TaxID=449393 RepID=A0A6J6SJ81_9ZZZZ|nr:hypothetical protein [Actinomycetota bacterium]
MKRLLASWLLPAVLVVVLAALVATSARLWSERGDDGLDAGAVAVARQAATNFFSLDHRHIDDDVQRMLDLATGDFADSYDEQSAALRTAVVDKQLVVTASLPEGGTATEYLGGDTAQVLVAVDVRTRARGGAVEDTRYRTRVVLTRVDDGWLVSGFEQVG